MNTYFRDFCQSVKFQFLQRLGPLSQQLSAINAGTQLMENFTEAREQLILELYVKSLAESINFYQAFSFKLIRQDGAFVELRWGENSLYLEEKPQPSSKEEQHAPTGNIRILVPDVDHYWNLAQKLQVRVFREIGDREYGLRDFTIFGPDGICLRFATRLPRT